MIFLQLMFEKFHVAGLHLVSQGAMGVVGSGRLTGVGVSSGGGVTSVVPVYNGYAMPQAIQTLDMGGHDITQHVRKVRNHPACQKREEPSSMSERWGTIQHVRRMNHPACQKGQTSFVMSERSDIIWDVRKVRHHLGCQKGQTSFGMSER